MLETLFSNFVQEEVNRYHKKMSPDSFLQATIIGDAIVERVLKNINKKIQNSDNEDFKNIVALIFDL
jgi:hypothetical protein